ncbi:hypothetical protein B0T20DRAFT_399131 [Sordaria brevicollis]|uniref:Uncharacterized protein n=1 Tax=Sordaria brevicollis TaxID=83679 RepID=A0AAE0PN23_SORBR|nr:hypothetical protein B0T20DRAFT_399131 [Sordaria brevicollis]
MTTSVSVTIIFHFPTLSFSCRSPNALAEQRILRRGWVDTRPLVSTTRLVCGDILTRENPTEGEVLSVFLGGIRIVSIEPDGRQHAPSSDLEA